MARKHKIKSKDTSRIAENRKARHDFALETFFEAGVMLLGWEVKAIRAGKAGIAESYVIIKKGEAWLLGANITPLLSASTHVQTDPFRTRKLLLHKKELNQLIGAVERKGYTIVPVKLYWKKGKVKLEIALAKGKKKHDKRQTVKERDWQRDKQRILKKDI